MHRLCRNVSIDRFYSSITNTLRDAGLQVVLQNKCFELFNGLTYGEGLAQYIDAVFILFDHLANTAEMSFDVVEPFEYVLFFSTHACVPLLYPYPMGMGTVYHRFRSRAIFSI